MARGARVRAGFISIFLLIAGASSTGCALTATRPVQEMSDTAVAIQAAKEVKADSLAPELYRQANEWFFLASQDYRLKNFHEARQHAEKARIYAERAEFEAIRNGAVRSETPPDPLARDAEEPTPKSSPDEYEPVSKPVFVETYESQQQQQAEQGAGGAPPDGSGGSTDSQEPPPL